MLLAHEDASRIKVDNRICALSKDIWHFLERVLILKLYCALTKLINAHIYVVLTFREVLILVIVSMRFLAFISGRYYMRLLLLLLLNHSYLLQSLGIGHKTINSIRCIFACVLNSSGWNIDPLSPL